eukprot:CAMPEP_0171350490 /NCGR_PEP_ID=MMETSP0878-20121228/36553_1 /TAXON_ID=67004 /ORGANISM="Thalassiosira weissflogii, Strain CCMP1336" /LENGTH=54 /DNA_ID=CAMNT_0011855421 /DNA_START=43 /DNA_END=203 /DNA_ORIENTATION=-
MGGMAGCLGWCAAVGSRSREAEGGGGWYRPGTKSGRAAGGGALGTPGAEAVATA